MSTGIRVNATIPASIKRAPAAVSGKRSTPVVVIPSVTIMPLMPVDPNIAISMGLNSPLIVKQTFCFSSSEIRTGDILSVNSIDYPIKFSERWISNHPEFYRLYVEERLA